MKFSLVDELESGLPREDLGDSRDHSDQILWLATRVILAYIRHGASQGLLAIELQFQKLVIMLEV